MSGSVIRLARNAPQLRSTRALYDVVIVGAGVVGCALARRFSQTGLAVAVIERASDVGEGGASKSNSAIAHCGFDADPGSLEAKLVQSASRRWPELARHLKIPHESVGALMVARNEDEMKSIEKYHKRGLENGVTDIEMLDGRRTREMEPHIFEGQAIVGGLHIPREDVVDPFATCAAYAETALEQGSCDFYFNAEVDYVKQEPTKQSIDSARIVIRASKQNLELQAKNVINSCGLGAKDLADKYGGASFTLNPRRGQFLVFDSNSRSLLNKILLPVPGPLGKGILITPTVFGNILAGPTAEDLPMEEYSEATQTTREGLDHVRTNVFSMLPRLAEFKAVAQYAGARSNCAEGSFIFRYGDGYPNVVTLAGIRSTGLSASFAIADEVFEQMHLRGMIQPQHEFRCEGRKSYPQWYRPSFFTGDDALTLCFCEHVPRGAVKQALASTLCPPTTDAIKRRTRVATGRCQGFNCLVDVCRQIAKDRSMPIGAISKRGEGSEWFPRFQNTLPPAYIKPSKEVHSGSKQHYTRTEAFQRAMLYLEATKAGKQSEIFQGDPIPQSDVIVIGGGPAGLGAIAGLRNSPKLDRILLLERSDRLGGIPARYPLNPSKKTFVHFTKGRLVSGIELAEDLRDEFFRETASSGKVDVLLNATVLDIKRNANNGGFTVLTQQGLTIQTRAIVVATGAREASAVERTIVTGNRPSGVVYANHLLSTGGVHGQDALSVGAGLVPRSIIEPSPKGSIEYVSHSLDESPWIGRWFFGGGEAIDAGNELRIVQDANGKVRSVNLANGRSLSISSVILGGCLVPNDELLVRSGVKPDALPPGIFLTGNVGANRVSGSKPWPGVACYMHAKHVLSKRVIASL